MRAARDRDQTSKRFTAKSRTYHQRRTVGAGDLRLHYDVCWWTNSWRRWANSMELNGHCQPSSELVAPGWLGRNPNEGTLDQQVQGCQLLHWGHWPGGGRVAQNQRSPHHICYQHLICLNIQTEGDLPRSSEPSTGGEAAQSRRTVVRKMRSQVIDWNPRRGLTSRNWTCLPHPWV